jgi:LysM repeat protein
MPFNLFLNLIDRADKLSSIKRTISVLVILSAITFISLGFNTHTFDRFYNAVQPHNQTYTELAFINPNNLPTVIPANNIITFTFWVHNVEGKTLVYPYTIIIKSGSTSTVIKKGEFYLGDNHQTSIKENVTVPSTSSDNTVSTPAAPVASGATYTVVSGDTMCWIAQNNNILLSQLEALNPQIKDPDLIFPGQSINLAGAVLQVAVQPQAARSQVEITLTNLNQTIDFWLKGNN